MSTVLPRPRIRHLIISVCIIFLFVMIFLATFSIRTMMTQFRSTTELTEYSANWNNIFVSMMEVANSLELVGLDDEDVGNLGYLEKTRQLDESVDYYIETYEEDEETANVLRRLKSFNEYQRIVIADSRSPSELFANRMYVDAAMDSHSDEVLSLYKSQIEIELANYTAQEEEVFRSLVIAFSLMLFSILAITLLYFIFAMIISRSMNRTLANLDGISRREWELSDLEGAFFYEFAKLYAGVNLLKHRLFTYVTQLKEAADVEKRLMEEKIKNEQAERMLVSAEMDMLRGQINPHFLFNALAQIGMAALIEEPQKAMDMVECTGKILRYSLYNKEKLVCLSDEIEIVNTYIRLNKLESSASLTFSVECPAELEGAMIVPMCIQPIVENCIKHGRYKDGRTIDICLTFSISDNILRAVVRDDGCGIEDASSILGKRKHGGIGLDNIRRRLELQYGRTGLIEIESRKDEGTEVVLLFPQEDS